MRSKTNSGVLALLALAVAFLATPAGAQTSVRPPLDVTGLSAGFVCDTANGWVVTTDSAGRFQCTQSIANATNATNAVNATTAQSATTAGQAQTLNPNAQVNASQISGVISANNLPAGSGNGGTTCVGGNIHVSGRPGTVGWAWGATPGSYFYADSGVSGTFDAIVPSMGSGQSQSLSVTGQASGSNYGAGGSGSAKATCNANGTFTWSNVGLSGCDYQPQCGCYICMTVN